MDEQDPTQGHVPSSAQPAAAADDHIGSPVDCSRELHRARRLATDLFGPNAHGPLDHLVAEVLLSLAESRSRAEFARRALRAHQLGS